MNDSIELKLVTEDETECLHRLQVEAFMPLYEKYQDDDTSPAKESLKRVTEKIIEENSDFYFIVFHGEKVGGVRVRWHQGKKVNENVNWISPIFIIPEFLHIVSLLHLHSSKGFLIKNTLWFNFLLVDILQQLIHFILHNLFPPNMILYFVLLWPGGSARFPLVCVVFLQSPRWNSPAYNEEERPLSVCPVTA